MWVFACQAVGRNSTKFQTPKADLCPTDGHASLGKQALAIAKTAMQSITASDGITDGSGWEPASFAGIHPPLPAT